ncbi:MAG: family 10 glycosylhydrolase, partial [Chloroflexi bacterium]|nr:family 10 glycosylhydrolase [Chloroflexota bacterium]
PTADFTAAPGTGLAPLSVAFTNTSTGVYTASLWLLGDGVTSTLPSPTHVYTAPGAYTVTLTVTGPGGSDTFTRPHCVTVTEVRALWVSRFEWTSPASPATPATIDTIVTKAAAARFNVILFQVRGTADALYDSELEPWSARLNSAGTLGVDPSWDPLAYMVERAHAAGLEVHAYINIYPAWAGESAPPSTTSPTHPFWTWSWWPGTGWGDWRQWDQNGPMLLNTDYLWASPGAPIVTDHIVSVALDIATRYPVDGLHLDYVRYAGAQYSCDPFTQDRCAADCYTPAWADWQRAQVTDLVQRIYQDRPSGVDLSAAVWPVYVDRWGWGTSEGRNDYYQDSQGWTAAGIIDALYPMLYYWDQTRFQTLVRDFQAHAAGRSIMPGIGAGTGDFNEIAARIRIARAARTAGHAIFSYGLLDQKGYWDDLVAPGGPYADE